MTEIALAWTLTKETYASEDAVKLLLPDEEIIATFKTLKDMAVFTDKRLIVRDSPALAPKKVETYVLPYSSVQMWSSDRGGVFMDTGAEVELWTLLGRIKISLKKEISLTKFETLLSQVIIK
ncbi:PH domain-containing protein [Streptococcus merionis]|uniref:PH domain-containing protein n=1 Tax=Streptococcus merionis TaxID=400065 RepID=UPI0035198598